MANISKPSVPSRASTALARYLQLVQQRLGSTSNSVRLAATVALLLSIVSGGYATVQYVKSTAEDKARGQRLVRRNSGLRGKDGSRTIYIPYKTTTAKVTIYPIKQTTFEAHRRLFLSPPKAAGLSENVANSGPPTGTRPGLNLAFLHQFLSLMSIMIPRWGSKELGLLLSQSMFLALRTYLSLVVARLDGMIVRDLVAGNGRGFLWGLVKWLGIGSFASYTNAAIKFLQSKLSIAFRTRLTRYIHDLYLNDRLGYYKLGNLDGGIGQGADQFITHDLTLFCDSAASLYSSIGKPFVDMCVFTFQLYKSLGPVALTALWGNYFLTATVLRKLSPPFGKLKALEGRREGDFRGLHSRLIANAEEICFYNGADIEKVFLDRSFRDLKSLMEGIYRLKIQYNMLEDFVLKYTWSAFGYVVSSLPVFLPAWGGLGGLLELSSSSSDAKDSTGTSSRDRRMKEFVTNKRLMLSLADAGGRLMYSIKDLSELAGYTSRIFTLISSLHRVHAGAYAPAPGTHPELFSLSDVAGTVQRGYDGVRMEQVPLVAPGLFPNGGDELLEALSFTVQPGEHMLITGANGVGKSAIARVFAGLWPVYRGLVSRPRNDGMDGIMFLPQRPYLSVGTLRDQVIYPHGELDMREGDRRDSELQKVLDDVHLGYLPEREGGWDVRKEWKNVFSGGEKQRMGFARLLYHEPRFAFIDEGTSAVSSDVEGLLYENAKERGITLITTSTRASLKKYHSLVLTLGLGDEGFDWNIERIGTKEEQENIDREIEDLKTQLAKVSEWEERRQAIEDELSHTVYVTGDEGETRELEEPSYFNQEH